MKYDEVKKNIYLEKQEINIIDTAILELGGPFRSPFAKHLLTYHDKDYNQIKNELYANEGISLDSLHLIIDILQVFIVETHESDWGTLYDDISKKEIEYLIECLIKVYSEQVKKY